MMNQKLVFAREKLRNHQYKEQLKDQERKLNYYKERIEILENIISKISPGSMPPKGISQQKSWFSDYEIQHNIAYTQVDVPLHETIISEIISNFQCHKTQRRYSETMLKFCFILRCLGSKSYDYQRSIFPFPSRQTLENHFGCIAQGWRNVLQDINSIPIMINLFRQLNNIPQSQIIDAVVGIDAMSIEPIFSADYEAKESKKQLNNVFIINLMPLDPRLKQLPIHLIAKENGSADKIVKNRISDIIDNLKEVGVKVLYKATDGDKGYMEWHREFFNKWWQLYRTNGIDAIFDLVNSCTEIPIADPLHIGKNMRSRIINGFVSVRTDGNDPFTASDVEQILKLGETLTDKSSTGKMKDFYVLELFNFPNFFKLWELNQFSIASYILPFACWFEALRNPNLAPKTRTELLLISFRIFAEHRVWVEKLAPCVTQNKKKKGVQYFCSASCLTRILNSIIAVLIEIRKRPEALALDRMGTHPLECFFGQVRLLCNYKHTLDKVMRNISRLLIIKDFATRLQMPLQIRNRINIGGVKMTGASFENINIKPPGNDALLFVYAIFILIYEKKEPSILNQKYQERYYQAYEEHMKWLLETFHTWKNHGQRLEKCYKGSRVSNLTIISRLINFKNDETKYNDI